VGRDVAVDSTVGWDVAVGCTMDRDVAVGSTVGWGVAVGCTMDRDVAVGSTVGWGVAVGCTLGRDVAVGCTLGWGLHRQALASEIEQSRMISWHPLFTQSSGIEAPFLSRVLTHP